MTTSTLLGRGLRLWAPLVFLFSAGCSDAIDVHDDARVRVLDGPHLFRGGDDPAWAARQIDVSEWHLIRSEKSLASQGVNLVDGWGWHRFEFVLPADVGDRPLAVALGLILTVDEVYLNGQRIGGTGRVEPFVDAELIPRAYAFPRGLARPGRTNVLAVRQLNRMDRRGLENPPIIGELQEVVAAAARSWIRISLMTSASVFLWLLLSAVWWVSVAQRASRTLNLSVGALLSVLLLVAVLSTLAACQLREAFPLVNNLQIAAYYASPPFIVACLHIVLDKGSPRTVALFGVSFGVVVLALLFKPEWIDELAMPFMTLHLGALITMGVWTMRAWREAFPFRLPIVIAVAATGAELLLANLGYFVELPLSFLEWYSVSVALWMLPTSILVVVAGRSLASQHRRLERTLQRLSNAEARERASLGRELHDGVGQDLQALRLQLLLSTESDVVDQSRIRKLADHLGSTLNALRELAHELDPGDNVEFVGRVKAHLARLDSPLVQANLPDEPLTDVPSWVAQQLLRILQEALGNGLRHGRASAIQVAVRARRDGCAFSIIDDGQGFDLGSNVPSVGIGLRSMEHRAQVIGADLHIESGAGGTRVNVVWRNRKIPETQ